jgi:hypothetical protein
LRRTDGLLDFDLARKALADIHSAAGRPSIDPKSMLQTLLIGCPADDAHYATSRPQPINQHTAQARAR